MAAVVPFNTHGPDTFPASVFIDGGLLVEPDPGTPGFIRPASAGSSTVLGVNLQPAEPATFAPDSTDAYGAPVLDISVPDSNCAIAFTGTYKLIYDDTVPFGSAVVCSGAGHVGPAVLTGSTKTTVADGVTLGPKANVTDAVLTAGSPVVTTTGTTFVATDVTRTVTGTGIPSGTTITAVNANNSITLSQPANNSASAVTLAFGLTFLVTSATAAFVATDEGRTISGGSIPASTTIDNIVSATIAQLTNAPTAAASGVSFVFGTTVTSTFYQVVGMCTEPLGVVAGSLGRTRLSQI
jgi:hypothetical protein